MLRLCLLLGVLFVSACSPPAATPTPTPLPSPAPTSVPSPTAAPTAVPTSPPTSTPISQRTPLPSSTPARPATSTPVTTPARRVWVANTDGGGVYLRYTPHDGDRAELLAENTPLSVTGELVDGDGSNWWPVRTQDGSDGYVPEMYTTSADPEEPPAELVP